jgi:hypothetical protein
MGDSRQGLRSWWRPTSRPLYPNACNSLGEKAGIFDDHHWWYSAGPARDEYQRIEPDIIAQLNIFFTDTIQPILHIQLYMIGRSTDTARPTIMFFGQDKDARKKAKKTVDNSGLLDRLPGFQTGHRHQDPGRGNLISPASDDFTSDQPVAQSSSASQHHWRIGPHTTPKNDGGFQFIVGGSLRELKSKKNMTVVRKKAMRMYLDKDKDHKKPKAAGPRIIGETTSQDSRLAVTSFHGVYYDPTHPVARIGMPILVEQSTGPPRKATANVVFEGQTCWLLSVSHVFSERTPSTRGITAESDDDFDLGSGSETEYGDNSLDATSHASVSSAEESSQKRSDSSSSDFATSPIWDESFTQAYDSEDHNRDRNTDVVSPNASAHLEQLQSPGGEIKRSFALDWVLIEVTNPKFALALSDVKTIAQTLADPSEQMLDVSLSGVVVWTAHGHLTGRLLDDTVCIRLPHSATFERLESIKLDAPIHWGDCGSMVSFATSTEPHGFVVASSSDRMIAYITSASRVLADSRTRWDVFAPIPTNRALERSPRSTDSMAPLIRPLETTDSNAYQNYPYPSFESFGEGVDPFKTAFQSSYPRVSWDQMKSLCRFEEFITEESY